MKAVFGSPPSLLWFNPFAGLRLRRLLMVRARKGGSEFAVWAVQARVSPHVSVPVKTPRVKDTRHDGAGTGTRGRECLINLRPSGGKGPKYDKLPVKTTGPQVKDHFYVGFSWLGLTPWIGFILFYFFAAMFLFLKEFFFCILLKTNKQKNLKFHLNSINVLMNLNRSNRYVSFNLPRTFWNLHMH